jgi:hypothetical protein
MFQNTTPDIKQLIYSFSMQVLEYNIILPSNKETLARLHSIK